MDLDIDIPSYLVEPDEPLNFVVITNRGRESIIEVALLADPEGAMPFTVHCWPEIKVDETWCIDDALAKVLSDLGIESVNPLEGKIPLVRFHLKFRRKIDSATFRKHLICGIIARKGIRPVAVYRGPEALLD